jgi:hypothetical protein
MRGQGCNHFLPRSNFATLTPEAIVSESWAPVPNDRVKARRLNKLI